MNTVEACVGWQIASASTNRPSRIRMAVAFFIISTMVVSLPSVHAAGTRVGPNTDIRGEAGSDRQVLEPAIAVDPRNPNIIVAGAADSRLVPLGGCFTAARCHRWPAQYTSTDGGMTWTSSLLPGFPGDTSLQGLTSPLRHFAGGADDEVAFDRSGNVYHSGIIGNLTSTGNILFSSLRPFVAKFANDGGDFVGATVLSSKGIDFPRLAVDTSGGPNDGNVYLTFDLTGTLQTGVFARSIDGGSSFSMPIQIPGAGIPRGVTVDPAGNIFVFSLLCTGDSLHCTSDASATILVAESTDGGLTFGRSVVAAGIKPIPISLPGNSFQTITFPQITADAKGVYIVWDDFGTGNANVLFTKSTDGGLTWSNPVRVNDVTQGQHFFPTIAVSGGIISVAWYDSRLGQLPNGTITGLDVFYAQSTDFGSSFSKNVRVTSASFDPNLVEGSDIFLQFLPFIGDYIFIAATPNAVHAVWTDNRNACDTFDPTFGCVDQDVFTATIIP